MVLQSTIYKDSDLTEEKRGRQGSAAGITGMSRAYRERHKASPERTKPQILRPRQIVVIWRVGCKIRSKDIKGKRIGCRKAKIVHQALRVHMEGIKVTRSMHPWVPSLRVVTR